MSCRKIAYSESVGSDTDINQSPNGEGSGIYADGPALQLHNVISGANLNNLDYHGNMIASSSHNVIGDGSQAIGVANGDNSNQFGSAGNILDVGLLALSDNGGPTQTHALRDTSPAIDAGDRNRAPDFDQRGEARSLDNPVDIGAFESQRSYSVQLPAGGGQYRVLGDSGDVVVRSLAGVELFRFEYAALNELIVVGSDGVDIVTVDLGTANAVPPEGVQFLGTHERNARTSSFNIVTDVLVVRLFHQSSPVDDNSNRWIPRVQPVSFLTRFNPVDWFDFQTSALVGSSHIRPTLAQTPPACSHEL